MSKKSVGGQAKELVLLFYDLTKIKFTNKDIMINVKNVKKLLETFTYEEIKDTIEYCVKNPPEKGIYSFGYISHNISKVTAMLKNQQKKIINETAISKNDFNTYGLKEISNAEKIKSKEKKNNINIFD